VEAQNGVSWKKLLVDGCAIYELPTQELLQFMGFLTDLLEIKQVYELEATHGLFSYLLRDNCPESVKINAIDPHPEKYAATYCKVVEENIPNQIIKFLAAKARGQLLKTMAVQMWPKHDDEISLKSLLQKEVLSVLVLIGEPNGRSGISADFDEYANNKNYRKFQLPLKQVCFLDTQKHAYATVPGQARSQVTMYLHTTTFPGFSEAGFIAAHGDSFLPNLPPAPTDRLHLQDYVLDGRVPAWIAELKGDDFTGAVEIFTTIMKTPAIFDGYIPATIKNMDQLRFYVAQCSGLQYPLIQDSQFTEWYESVTQLPENGLAHYRRAYNMPDHIKTIKTAEEWLWARFSQRIAPPGWDSSSLALRTRFEQLWTISQGEKNLKCNAGRPVPQRQDISRSRLSDLYFGMPVLPPPGMGVGRRPMIRF
jgi:hypothetical protein